MIRTEPGPSASSHNYYGYRQTQFQTASPYLNKRNPDSETHSSAGHLPARSTANQCKLHINCPSKRKKEFQSRMK